jgi:hypothetical protein
MHSVRAHSPIPSGAGGAKAKVMSVDIGVWFAITSVPFFVTIESSGYKIVINSKGKAT